MWNAQVCRYTYFFEKPMEVDQKYFRDIWSNLDIPVKESSFLESEHKYFLVGEYKNSAIRLICSPERVDFVWENSISSLDKSIGKYPEIITDFVKMVSVIANNEDKNINRIAYGAILTDKVKDREEGYKRIFELLPFSFDENYRDMIFQINKLTKSKIIESLKVNRITKWAVLKVSPHIVSDNKNIELSSHFGASLELDISTDKDYENTFSHENIIKVFTELTELGEILSKNELKDA